MEALKEMGGGETLLLRTLSSSHLTPILKLNSMEALRFSSLETLRFGLHIPSGEFPSTAHYCRFLLEQSEDAAVREGCRDVLFEAQKRIAKHEYLRAGMSQSQSAELLRAAAGEGDSGDPNELLRSSKEYPTC